MRSFSVLIAALALSACANITVPPSAAPGAASAPTITLPQAQNASKVLYATIKAQVAAYEQNAALDAQTQADLDLSVTELGQLEANFVALPPDADYVDAANAFLTATIGIIGHLPAGVIPQNIRAAIDAGIATVQAVLTLTQPTAVLSPWELKGTALL